MSLNVYPLMIFIRIMNNSDEICHFIQTNIKVHVSSTHTRDRIYLVHDYAQQTWPDFFIIDEKLVSRTARVARSVEAHAE